VGGGTVAKILIVDDSSFMRKRIAQALLRAGHEIVGQAQDGAEAFELFKKLHPDLVVMDVTMRGTDGMAGTKMIRSLDSKARIVFMSLISDPDVMSEAKKLGAVGFIGKNEYDRLLSLVECCE
jgi:two-component system chemotaxis response regulator CheY